MKINTFCIYFCIYFNNYLFSQDVYLRRISLELTSLSKKLPFHLLPNIIFLGTLCSCTGLSQIGKD